MPTNEKRVTFRLKDDLYNYLEKRASKENRTISNLIVHLLTEFQNKSKEAGK